MSRTVNIRRSGFTLLELLVVVAIIVALVAILTPVVMSYRNKSNIDLAHTQIGLFKNALMSYAVDHGSYPTTEQGLNALIYIPLNEGQQTPGMMQQPGYANPMDPSGGMNVGATPLGGPGAFNDPNAMPGMSNMPGDTGSMGSGAVPLGGNMSGANTGFPGDTGVMMPGVNDPTMMMGGGVNAMDSTGGMMTGFGGNWTNPEFNPQLYVNARKRLDPYIPGDTVKLDPWRRPYRYSFALVNGINPMTGDREPAIWSAGPDGIDGNDDDIRSWNPQVAADQRALQQQQMLYPGSGMSGVDAMGNPLQPGAMDGGLMSPMGTQPNMMMPDPMGMQPNMAPGPMTPGPMAPGPMTPGPMTPGPMTPGPMTPGPMAPGPMTPGPMAPGPMTPGPMAPGPSM